MKVVHIIKSLGRGGAETLLPECLRLHDRGRFAFSYLYFLPWKDQMAGALRDNGGEVICLPANNHIQLMMQVRKVVQFIRGNKVDLIHAHLPWAGIVARMAGRLAGIPVVYTEHNKQERYHPGTRRMNLLTMNWQSGVIAVSDDVATSLRNYRPSMKPWLKVVVNGVNTDRFGHGMFSGDEIRKHLGIPSHANVIGTVAVFRVQKRLDAWLEVAAALARENPNIYFIVVGDGPLKDELIRKRKELSLESRVFFPGLQEEVRPWLAAFDIFMMSSVFEGLPVAMLEAMAMALPVVSTDAGGIAEAVRDNIDGLLCPVDEPQRLVPLAQRLLTDEPLRKRMGASARQRAVEAFSLRRTVAALEDIYTELISRKRP